jgi:hypothetical protein
MEYAVRPDGPFAGDEPADPNVSAVVPEVVPVAETFDPNTPDVFAEPEPDTLSVSVADELGMYPITDNARTTRPTARVAADGSYGGFANSYDSYYDDAPLPADPWIVRADEILSEEPFTEPDDESASPIWEKYRELVESTVDATGRSSVLRAGWLALRGEIGEGE